ncbi:putative RNA-directed DNA polymerase, eukaryota, reverse transcriptase zinc-binding domain protein [Tanacetum coccineum]
MAHHSWPPSLLASWGSSDGPKRRRTYIYREREEAEQRLIDDYFGDDEYEPKYPEESFKAAEAVADQKLWIWHAYFGVPEANNDLNVLYGSPLFDDEIADIAPECPFVVNVHTYRKCYYLADYIYPAWSTFVKTFSVARDEKTLKFKRVKEAARKDIERFRVLQGDFNEVREEGERYGSNFCERQARIFNDFITENSLIDIPLGGFNFTWTNKWGTKMSKLDRFLVSESFYETFPHATGLVLEKGIPDHRPILLKESITWKNDGIVDVNGFTLFKKKLQNLKKVIRVWISSRKSDTFALKKEHQHRLSIIDSKIDQGCASDEDFKTRRDSLTVLANRLSNVIGDCISPVQSAFIKGRYILDGPIILNEVLAEYRQHNKELLVFKVDFEKAFDSLHWDFLDAVMEKMGFGIKWRSWISGCLHNARSSILVNGSPTKEFELFRGLRQGDPLSPFLFILAMEGLHSLTCKAEEIGLFKGASIGRDNMSVSHLMYADDVIFFGEWSQVNTHNLLCMLHCFFLISGLKINVDKSIVLGVGVSTEEVAQMASIIGCGVSKFPFKYLGVPVGGNMSRCVNWDVVIQKFSSKLSSWKARLLSVGGRLSLIKAVLGNLPTYFMSIYLMPVSIRSKLESMRSKNFRGVDLNENKMSWVKWERCLASKKNGGLGIGSIYGLNIGLLFKWIWRFLTRPSDLWARVIGNIYGYIGDIDRNCPIANRTPLLHSDWSTVLRRSPRGGVELA